MLLIFLILSALLPVVWADVKFVTPAAGASIPGGGKISVSWTDSGDDPPLSSLTTYALFLVAGGNDAASQIEVPLAEGKFSDGTTASGTVLATFGDSVDSAYFLKMMSPGPGGTIINYSPRFSLTGMKGTFPPNVEAAIEDIAGTEGPPDVKPKTPKAAWPVGSDVPEAYAIPFPSQSGQIFYAPMVKRPGTKITAKNASPLFPTSSVKIATGALPRPVQTTTFTLSQTITTESIAHTASPAAYPMDDMQKYLARWRD